MATTHTVVRGFSTVARSCPRGAELSEVFRDPHGRLWSKCPNDPADWNKAFVLLPDQSKTGYLELIRVNTQSGPAVSAMLAGLNR
jgi:hypothetical protein